MLNFEASKPRVKGGARAPGASPGSVPERSSHTPLILAKSSLVQKPIDAETKVELNIPQLTLVKIAHFGSLCLKMLQGHRGQEMINSCTFTI